MQAASAGEAYLAVSLARNLKPERPLKVLVTSTTAQGMDILKSGLTPDRVSRNMDLNITWFPFDMPDIIRQAGAVISPKVLVLLETELWPGLLHCLKQKGARILVVNARMSKKALAGITKQAAYGNTWPRILILDCFRAGPGTGFRWFQAIKGQNHA
nr:hypothetical protein [Desulfobacula sp.]